MGNLKHKRLWHIGVCARDSLRNSGILGPLDPVVDKLVDWTFRPPSQETETVLPMGLKLTIPAGCKLARNLAAGVYEKELTALFLQFAKTGMNIVDLGAHIGYYTILGSRLVGSSGKVYAFEPDPRNMTYLLKNVTANGCSNVVAVEKAVSDTTGLAYLLIDQYNAKSHLSTIPSGNSAAMVQTVKLDDFFREERWPRIDLVKADIEGGERAALEGMRKLCRRNPQMQLIMECNLKALRRAGATRESLVAILLELGFSKGYIIERGMEPFDVAKSFPTRSSTTYNLLLQG